MTERQWDQIGWVLIAVFFVLGIQDPEFLPICLMLGFPALLIWAAFRDPTK